MAELDLSINAAAREVATVKRMKNKTLGNWAGLMAVGVACTTSAPARGDTFFVSNYIDGTISRISATGVKSTFATVNRAPYGLVFDRAGNLFVAQAQATNKISLITPGGSVSTYKSLAQGYDATTLAYGPDGAMYVASQGGFNIRKAGATTAFATGFTLPFGMVFDQDGTLYVADQNNARISKVARNGTVSLFLAGISGCWGMALDASGNLYASSGSVVYKIKTDGTKSVFASGFSFAGGIAFDTSGDLYVVDQSANSVKRVSPDGMVHAFASGFNQPLYIAVLPDTAPSELTATAVGAFSVKGGLEQWYVVSWSPDFTNWTPLRTNRVAAGSSFTVSDSGAGFDGMRFYRAQARP